MEPIGVTTKRVLGAWQKAQHNNNGAALQQGIKQILTKQEQRHVKACLLQNSRVFLGIDSSAWLYILSFKKRQLLKRLNHILQYKDEIIDIILKLDVRQGNIK